MMVYIVSARGFSMTHKSDLLLDSDHAKLVALDYARQGLRNVATKEYDLGADKKIARKAISLYKATIRTQNTLSRATGARKGKGGRIQSTAEVRASSKALEASSAYSSFCRENGIPEIF